MVALAQETRRLLESLADLLAGLEEPDYRAPCAEWGCGNPGGHTRHCIEFHQCFLDGHASGFVDYDARARDPELENEVSSAISALGRIAERSEALAAEAPDKKVRVRECGDTWLESTLAREVRFLLSHTIHHMALLAMLLRSRGVIVPEGFGLAPSTRRYRESVSQPTC